MHEVIARGFRRSTDLLWNSASPFATHVHAVDKLLEISTVSNKTQQIRLYIGTITGSIPKKSLAIVQ
jgi:hypothetical protein